jgi:uracil-DNA glycosylase family 4
MKIKPTACAGCPYEHQGLGYVPGEGPTDARIAFLGQAPGENEAHQGRPFFEAPDSRRAGWRLSRWLEQAQLRRSEVWIDNIVRCWIRVGEEDEVPAAAISQCWDRHILPALNELPRLEYVVPVGVPAMQKLIDYRLDQNSAGAWFTIELPTMEEHEEGMDDVPF